MLRFWPSALLLCFAGCAGRSVEGRWTGDLPMDGAQNCQMRLLGNGWMDFGCGQPAKLEGAGKWRLSGDELTITWTHLRVDGQSREAPNRPFRATLRGPGNEIRVEPKDGSPPLTWKRAPL